MTMAAHVIREARERAGLSQAELARRLGTRQPVVARWEAGARTPSFDTVVRAVRACGLDLSFDLYTYDYDDDLAITGTLHLSTEERIGHLLNALKVQELLHSAKKVEHARHP